MKKESLDKKVIREIISDIFHGIYRDGHRLMPERQLSERFGVSRGTIRQALRSLEKLCLIKIRHGSGAYIRNISKEKIPHQYLPPDFKKVSIKDIIAARKAIEIKAAELACLRITKSEIKKLEKIIYQMKMAINDLPAFLEFDMNFHYAIVRAGKNTVLMTAFQAIYEYHKYSQIFTSRLPGDEETALNYHTKVLRAVKLRNVKLVRETLIEHLDSLANPNKKKKLKGIKC